MNIKENWIHERYLLIINHEKKSSSKEILGKGRSLAIYQKNIELLLQEIWNVSNCQLFYCRIFYINKLAITLSRGVFTTQSNTYDEAFLRK